MTPMPGQKPSREDVIATWEDIINKNGDKNFQGEDPLDKANPPPKPEKPKQ